MIAEKRKIFKWIENTNQQEHLNIHGKEDWIACEIILKIIVNRKELVRFACSPVDCTDLVIGFLFSEGIISHPVDIDLILYNKNEALVDVTLNDSKDFDCNTWQAERTISSGCGQGVISKLEYRRKNLLPINFKASATPNSLSRLFHHLKANSEWYEKTGCIHTVMLFNEDDSVITRDDIGRHNAVDKVIGAALQCGINFSNTIMNCSGRLSSDMVLKAARAGIIVLVSKAAPTTLAVDIANELGLTLIGFARGKRFNIYSHPENISLEDDLEYEISREFKTITINK
jgi:FdhD protein